ncbi:MAG: hypothetical protein H0U74_17325 [Bradymonadaceae bacterium]|nr:hypothetical protein [Lujinxingiaceae bacterium]
MFRPSYASFLGLWILVAATVFPAHQAYAYRVLDDEELRLDIGALAETGWALVTDDHPRDNGPYISMARLNLRADYKGLGRVFLQYEAASGAAQLLDLLTVLNLTSFWQLRAGYFKVPTSEDYVIRSAQKRFPTRSLLAGLVPRRAAGVESSFEHQFGDVTGSLQLGVFSPFGRIVEVGGGQLLSARARVALALGLAIHVGYADRVGESRPVEPTDPFFLRHDRLIDLAAVFESGPYYLHAEVLIPPDRAYNGQPAATFVAAAYRFGEIDQGLTIEPVVGHDWVNLVVGGSQHRVRSGLNLYVLDHRLVPALHYEWTRDPAGAIGHAVLAQVRMTL